MDALPRPDHTRGAAGEYLCRHACDFRTPDQPDALRRTPLGLRVVADDDDGSGTFQGWACVFDVVDSYGTTFAPGCFEAGGLQPTPYPLLWMHSPFEPTGTFTAEERSDGGVSGLWIEGTWDATVPGQTGRMRAASGSAPELSVGFVWLDDGGEDDPDTITKARLVETSQITLRMAAVPGAGFRGQDTTDEEKARDAQRAQAAAHLTLATLLADVS
jgi:phage head maturation protease